MEKIYRAAKYIRTSCPDDETQYSDSVANQRRLIDAFIQSHPEIIVVAERIDEGYSGMLTERPAFRELLLDVEMGAINCIIVKDLSRWNRDYIETGRYLRNYFPAHGVRFISIDDSIDMVRPDGFDKTIALLKSIFSEHYSRDVSVKTRSSLDAKRRQGKYVGAIPIYGYQKTIEDKHQLIPDPNTADIVQSIFRMKLQGMSANAIATKLNILDISSPLSYKRECSLPHATGGFSDKSNPRWSATTVLRVLRDENHTGTLVQGRQHRLSYKIRTLINQDESEWTKTINAHPAIISRSDYEAVQRIFSIDTRTSPKHEKVHVFSGMLICGCCGGNMTRKIIKHKERHYIYYRCQTGNRNGCHSPSTINENDLVSVVTSKVRERIADIERLNTCISKSEIQEIMQSERNKQINVCDMKICDLKRYKLHLHNSRTEGFLNDIEYQELIDFYDREIIRIDDESSMLRKEPRFSDAPLEDSLEWIQNFLKFSHMIELDRFAVVKMIRSIHVLATKEIRINFAYQVEFEQLLRCASLGGYADGEKKPQAE